MGKKKPEQTVKIEMYRPPVQPDEGDWYQVQAWHKPNDAYSFMFNDQMSWQNHGHGATVLSEVLDEYVKAREVYAKVRILKTTRRVINSDDF